LNAFAIAFVQYLQYLITLDFLQQVVIKGVFLFSLTYVNIRGVKAAGKLNDFLTIAKLSPLFLLIGVGLIYFIIHPSNLIQNYTPLIPLGINHFGTALVLIFWAYVGFEIGTLPASEMKNPKTMIPKAIIVGILIVTFFYISTNFVVYGVIHWSELTKTSIPLVVVGSALLGTIGAGIMSIGALISVSGSDESGILGTARISYAMAIGGLFPRIFAKVHPKFGTPFMALAIQAMIAFTLSIFSGIAALISFSVSTSHSHFY
jgi:amino acid transporter